MPCIHFLRQWFSLPDTKMEEAFFDVPWCCEFAQLDFNGHMLKKNTIFKFCNRLVKGKLADAILATVIDLLDAQYFPCGSGRAGR